MRRCAGKLGGALAHLGFQVDLGPFQHLHGPLAIGDVERDPLQERGVTLLVPHDLALPMHPDHPAIAGEHAVFRAELHPRRAGAGKLRSPSLAVIGVDAVVPQERVVEPLLLGKPKQRFDLRADVELVMVAVQ